MQILLSTLSSSEGVTKNHIIRKACLSPTQIKGYIPLVIQNDLLEYNPDFRTFRLTEKGMKLIKLYNIMKGYVKH